MQQTPPNHKRSLSWLLQMAWRDSRKNRSRLLLFISSIVFGIAALVGIYSFSYNLQKDINDQAGLLIGSDLMIAGNKPVSKTIQPLLDSLGDDRSQERSFASMVLFPKGGGTRLVQIKALQGNFPYYGEIETTPKAAGRTFKNGRYALVDKTLMQQFGVKVNDSVKVGKVTFLIAGKLEQAPGQNGVAATVAPIVYVPLSYLNETGLIDKGSRVNTSYYYKFNPGTNVDKLAESIDGRLDKEGLHYETIATRKESTGRSFGDLANFLSLVGFIALLLGCVGVASATNIYIREKIPSIAIMRCLGVKAWEAFLIFLIQILGIGFIGSVIGALLGTLVQQLLPMVLKDFLPFTMSADISWLAFGQGVALGMVISVLFALLPLLSIRNISPLNTLRITDQESNAARDPLRWLVYALILAFIASFTYLQLKSWPASAAFTAGILVAFGILSLVAWLLMRLMRLLVSNSWSYLARQGFANLYRPNNQTIILMVSIGLSTMFICTLIFIQSMLIQQVSLSTSGNQPNMILFDIQTNQQKGVEELTKQNHLPVVQQVPIVTIKLEKINNITAASLKNDTTKNDIRRALAYEYRVTYRDFLTSTEKITAGKWTGKATSTTDVPVSLDERLAKRIHAKIGDHLTFNVQGTRINTIVGSLRKVNWSKVQTNFQVVFPTGVLEEAPKFFVELTHVPSSTVSAKFQQAVVQRFPNVSIIDLGLVLTTLDELLDKIGYIIRFMSAFSMITGLVVLIASVRISKYQRMRESVLLRTLGASRRQIFTITALEYLFLGTLSALTGIVIGLAGSILLAKYSFDLPFVVNYTPALWLLLGVAALTVAIGLLNSRGALNKPPLEILRST
ncbi:ABC transporter permease [Mucilaginibacter koreensis]